MRDKKDISLNMAEILVVEDSPTQAELLRYILEEQGYRVTLARDGRQALEQLNNNPPALVISDIVMPEMDGFELCDHIKCNQETGSIPVILLTTLAETNDVMQGLACAADGFITKPYSQDYLLAQVKKMLGNGLQQDLTPKIVELAISIAGKTLKINADPQRIVSMVLSVYDAAIHRNKELLQSQDELRSINENLENLVDERTAELSAEIAERQHLQDELKVLSLHDGLTGLLNRHGFMTLAEQHHRLALRSRQGFSLVYMDMNDLKSINDTYGHAQGDNAIKSIAQTMEHSFRESDILGRLGGDEFIALLADCDPHTTNLAIKRLEENLGLVKPVENFLEALSVSVGLAHFDPDQPISITEMLEKADAEMYKEKRLFHESRQI